jgi:hypothetical protein
VLQTDALIRFFLKQEPESMPDEKYNEVAGSMWWVLKVTGNYKEENGKITFVK